MNKKRFLSLVLLVVVLAVSMTGCSKENAKNVEKDSQSNEDVAENDVDEKTSEDLEGSTINIVATSEKYKELFDKFTEETGIKVEFLSMSSGEVLSRTKAEGGKPMADVWFGGGVDAFMEAKEEGLLEQYEFEGADKIVEPYKDPENYWFTKGLTVVGFIVNNDILEENNMPMPKSWDDLTNPVYKDEILMSNPAISGTNYGVVNSLLQNKGEEEGWKYFKDLNKNIPFYTKRGSDPKDKTLAGEATIGITPMDNSLEEMVDEQNISLVYPEDGIPWVPEGVAIFKNSSNLEGAKKFISWFYQDENLREVARIDNKDTVKIIKPSLEGLDSTFPVDKLLKQDVEMFGVQREEILEKWEKLAGDKSDDSDK